MNCREFNEIIDSYLAGELLVETNHDVLRHLEHCPACRGELADHRTFRNRLRSAVRNAPDVQIDPAFAARLKESLSQKQVRPPSRRIFNLVAFFNRRNLTAVVAFGALLFAVVGAFWLNSRNSSTEKTTIAENEPNVLKNGNIYSQEPDSPVAQAVQIAWREMTHAAAGDHQNCALKFNLKEKPISLAEAAEKYGKFNRNLEKAVSEPLRESFPAGTFGAVKLLAAHSCVFNGRRFAHIVLRRRNETISVLVTETDASNGANKEVISQTNDKLQVAGFSTKNHLIFVVSDLPPEENLTVARIIADPIRRQIENSEV